MTVSVLIVDDSRFFRRRLEEIISSDPNLVVIGTAENGQHAIEQVNLLKPDIVTMDIEMPVMNGIEAVRQIMSQRPTPIMMLSTWSTDGAKATLEALEAGAIDYMPKRFTDISGDKKTAQQKLCQQLYRLAKKVQTHASIPTNTVVNAPAVKPVAINQAIKLIAIGTSTGGPVALQKVLAQLPATFPYPIVLIQHMPATFTLSFAERLNSQCTITVKQAVNGEKLSSGTAYLAPGGQQMKIKGNKDNLHLDVKKGAQGQPYHPCVDITLQSISQICPTETLAIILTGMGSDGCEGCRVLKKLGASIWAQDEKSSTIYGMPKAIAQEKLADKILSVTDIGSQLAMMS